MAKLFDLTLNTGYSIKVPCNDAANPRTNELYLHINHLRRWRKGFNNLAGLLFKLVFVHSYFHFCDYSNSHLMGGQLKRLEPDNCESFKNDGEVWSILVENGIATFLEKMTGYSALVSYAVTASWSRGRVQIGSTRFTISTNAIADATGLPAAGDIYYRRSLHAEIQDFNAPGDRPKKYLSGYTRDSLPSPWDRVAEVIMRYFTIDGRYRLVFGPHLFILSHLRWGRKINLAAFLFQSLEHSVMLAREGEGVILHQGLLYLLFSVAASHSDLLRFPPKMGRRRRSPSPSSRPSSSSLRSSRRRRRLLLSSGSDSDVAIDTNACGHAPSPVSSPGYSSAADLLGLAHLYPDSPEAEQCDINQHVAEPSSQSAEIKDPSIVKDFAADTPLSPPIMDSNPADTESADAKKDHNRAEIISSILSKLQRAFKALKAWEDFTDSTRAAIADDCSELLKLADLLANESGSPRAKNVVSELKKLI
ncbi:hypothetical protein KI387_043005 [Taxus chinensis]|uniref:Uncharacterized protein n=1 Tax=Taxus chinensis TaxID=29808 RepID=A0AA38F7N4_TAXCH|nr:hypothetical protein KI387_043005 [Taxus chinensis]